MDIKSSQAAGAYTTPPATTPPADNTLLKTRTEQAPGTETTPDSQRAFEVTLTPEAQTRLAADATQASAKTQPAMPENKDGQNTASAHQARQLVDIVA